MITRTKARRTVANIHADIAAAQQSRAHALEAGNYARADLIGLALDGYEDELATVERLANLFTK
jgi:hypothetical protein